jgi:hypothetical protein
MFTSICLSILGVIVLLIGLIALVAGFVKDVRSIKIIGACTLLVLAVAVGCYLMNYMIPVIAIIGLFAVAFTLVGTSGEDSKDSFKFGVVYMIVGLYLFFNTFVLWYSCGYYTSMAFAAWFMCFTLVINALNALYYNKDLFPILSFVCSILFALLAIYMWMLLGLKGMPIFWSGTFAAIFARSMWWLLYGRKLESESRLSD